MNAEDARKHAEAMMLIRSTDPRTLVHLVMKLTNGSANPKTVETMAQRVKEDGR
jgi:hypothetical protein